MAKAPESLRGISEIHTMTNMKENFLVTGGINISSIRNSTIAIVKAVTIKS